ncbi:hypothetical protein CEXT_782081 [Caerostris extrusa]|uniref:Uncharacterized protein n=1 Tax=Caerostris extrusa TaxID=172846 RepID=A0AAV4XE92_CAEEX|nr:hypothetical protein CEXT_782081 [Caerostris extrusa]
MKGLHPIMRGLGPGPSNGPGLQIPLCGRQMAILALGTSGPILSRDVIAFQSLHEEGGLGIGLGYGYRMSR